MTDVTRLLGDIERGDQRAAGELLPLVYNELRKLAACRLAAEPSGQTLEATALVHEAYLRLVGSDDQPAWEHRGHFFAAAAEAMRRILVDNARRKRSLKRGGQRRRVELGEVHVVSSMPPDELVALDDALQRLAEESPQQAELVKLRCFAGLTLEEAADALGVARSTASKHWAFARAWLYREVSLADDAG